MNRSRKKLKAKVKSPVITKKKATAKAKTKVIPNKKEEEGEGNINVQLQKAKEMASKVIRGAFPNDKDKNTSKSGILTFTDMVKGAKAGRCRVAKLVKG
jgi:hypothetical protein